jgi:hypothetical protein
MLLLKLKISYRIFSRDHTADSLKMCAQVGDLTQQPYSCFQWRQISCTLALELSLLGACSRCRFKDCQALVVLCVALYMVNVV